MSLPEHFLAVFQDVDRMLNQIDATIVASHSHSPFNDYLTQLTPEQQRIVEHGISELRTAMICILRQHGLVTNDPHINTAYSIQKTLEQAAARLDDFDRQPGAGPPTAYDGETAKLLSQMRSVLAHMDRGLSTVDPSFKKKVGVP